MRVADADQRELHVSLRCALKNLLAAGHFGYRHRTSIVPEGEGSELAAVVPREPNGSQPDIRSEDLFAAILECTTNQNVFDARPVSHEARRRLEACDVEEAVRMHLTDDPTIKHQVHEMIFEVDAQQFAEPEWREELGTRVGRGVFGTPWLMSKVAQLAVTYLNQGPGTAKKDTELLMSAPLLAVMDSGRDGRASRIKASQVPECAALTTAALGIRVRPMSQILEILAFKSSMAQLIPSPAGTPKHTFRLGFADPEEAPTPRRPLAEVLLQAVPGPVANHQPDGARSGEAQTLARNRAAAGGTGSSARRWLRRGSRPTLGGGGVERA